MPNILKVPNYFPVKMWIERFVVNVVVDMAIVDMVQQVALHVIKNTLLPNQFWALDKIT